MEACDWDAPLPKEKFKEWKLWRDSLKELELVKIPRTYTSTCLSLAHKKEICIFCDGSTNVIAAVSYLKTTDSSGNIDVSFIFGKDKLTPRPEITVLRLELCAAFLPVEIAEAIINR